MAKYDSFLGRPPDDPRGKPVSQVELCDLLGITRTVVMEWGKEGLPHVARGNGQKANEYNVAHVLRWLHRRELAEVDQDESPNSRLARVKADLIEREIAEVDKELVRVSTIEGQWSRVIMAIRAGVMQIPSVAPLLATCTGVEEVRGMLDSRCREILERLAVDPSVEDDDSSGDESIDAADEDDGSRVGDTEEDAV